MDSLVVGLGNPGREYEDTKHNIGWLALDKLSFARELSWREKFKGLYTQRSTTGGDKAVFLKPQTYMNLSGESARPCADFFKIPATQMLVVQDELDLPFGTLAFKKGGGLAGHNGLKSLAKHFGTQDFVRLRLGIGRPPYGDVSSWVLSGFQVDDRARLDEFLALAAEAIELYVDKGFDAAARKFSRASIK